MKLQDGDGVKVISVRFRDIPYSEVKRCIPLQDRALMDEESWEKGSRGRNVEIEIPAVQEKPPDAICDGPWFNVVGENVVCCPHYVEIGD